MHPTLTAISHPPLQILANDLEAVLGHLLARRGEGGSVAIILDNAGLETIGDLCLAEFLLHSRSRSSSFQS